MGLKEKMIALLALMIGIVTMLFVVFELNNTNNRVYLYSVIEVNNTSIEEYNNKIDEVNKSNQSTIDDYNRCIKSVGKDTDLFSCGLFPQLKIFKKLNKIDMKNL